MTTITQDTRLPSPEGFKQLLDVLKSFGPRTDIVTVEICKAMESKYGHTYTIQEMEKHLQELVKHNGLRNSGTVMATHLIDLKNLNQIINHYLCLLNLIVMVFVRHQYGMFK